MRPEPEVRRMKDAMSVFLSGKHTEIMTDSKILAVACAWDVLAWVLEEKCTETMSKMADTLSGVNN